MGTESLDIEGWICFCAETGAIYVNLFEKSANAQLFLLVFYSMPDHRYMRFGFDRGLV